MKRSELPPYVADGKPEHRHPDAPAEVEPYIPAPDLVTAVQLAIHLRRPLLIEGEPGCGKTRLAYSVASVLGIPIEPWAISSSSRASDGLYQYDAILRLHDVQIARDDKDFKAKAKRDPANPNDYVALGAIGRAFDRQDTPSVVLIDEIDKANVDFANDLLTVLDRKTVGFTVREAGDRQIAPKPDYEPIFIVTSNREKGNLPDPFLRRCVYHFVRFPSTDELTKIVETHYRAQKAKPPLAVDTAAALARFMPLRKELEKPPGTSELLDWLEVLQRFNPGEWAAKVAEGQPLPFPQVLVKIAADLSKALPARAA